MKNLYTIFTPLSAVLTTVIAIALTAITACTSEQPKAEEGAEAPEKMVGEWELNSVLISIKTAHRTGGDSVINFPTPADWVKLMQQKPIHTVYRADHSYEATYRNLKDSIVALRLGVWAMPNDSSLQLFQQDPFPDTSYIDVRFLKDGAEFRRFRYDYDNDGNKDDEFFGIQRKISSSK
ncbi:MAG: hypothetical protein RI894_1099 [Bacteroidota bacterium]